MVNRSYRQQDGFSLTELMVVLVLLGVILAVSYGGLLAVYKGDEVSSRQAMFANEVAAPMVAIERVVIQSTRIVSASAYSIEILTDRDYDGAYERHIIQATSAGELIQTTWDVNTGDQTFYAVWSTHNVNVRDGLTLFVYKDEAGSPISAASALVDAKSIDFEIQIEYDGTLYSDKRTMFLRNR